MFILIGLAYLARRSPSVLLLTLWIVAAAVQSSLSARPRFFTRYWYLPSIASSTLTAAELLYLHNRLSSLRFARAAAFVFGAILLIAAHARCRAFEWRYLLNTARYHQYSVNDPATAIPLYHRVESDYGVQTGLLYASIGNAYGLTGDFDTAFQFLGQVGRVDPAYALSTVEDLDLATQDILALVLLGPLLENDTWRARAAEIAAPIEYRRGNFSKALSHYTASLGAGDSARAFHGRGKVHFELGNHAKALADLDQSLAIDPTAPDVHKLRGRALAGIGRFGKAVAAFEAAANIAPSDWGAHHQLGVALLKTGQTAQALTPLREAVRLAPEETGPLMDAAIASTKLGYAQEARRLFQHVLTRAPDHPQSATIQQWLGSNAQP